ncbi:MAG: TVP38/TMEM64 family protein, partial [Lachnospiraceae bacterium]
MNKDMGKHVKNICTVIGGVLLCALFLMGSKKGLFTSRENLKIFLNQFGLLAPLIFMLIQILQVIFPIIPGALGCAAGIVIWGPGWGFLFNYISICIGSTFNFIIAKKYGKPIIDKLFSLKQIKKYEKKLNNGNGFQT